MKPAHPMTLRKGMADANQALFDAYAVFSSMMVPFIPTAWMLWCPLQISRLPEAAFRGGEWPGNRYAPCDAGVWQIPFADMRECLCRHGRKHVGCDVLFGQCCIVGTQVRPLHLRRSPMA